MNIRKILPNFFWRYAEKFLIQIVDLVVNIFLARRIAPEVFGTIALINVFNNILQIFVTGGFSGALVQKKDSDDLDFSSVFYFNIVSCSLLYIVMFFSAPVISSIYRKPELVSLIRVLCLTLIISGIKSIQNTYVSFHMLFKRFFFASLAGTVIAAICSVIMAYKGFGVWSLVALQLLDILIDTIVLWFTVKWRPQKVFSLERLKILLPFGSKILIYNLIDKIYSNLRSLIIGKKYSTSDLAFFEKGRKYPVSIYSNISSTFTSVLFPAISKVQDDKEKVKEMLSTSLKTSIFLEAPLLFGLATCAEYVIKIILTDKWLPAVPYLQLFSVVIVIDSIRHISTIPIKSLGLGNELLRINLIEKTVGISMILISMNKSVFAIAWGTLAASLINLLITMLFVSRNVGYTFENLFSDILPLILLASAMALIVSSIKLLNLNYVGKLLLQILLGGIIYVCGSLAFKLQPLKMLTKTVRQILQRKQDESPE